MERLSISDGYTINEVHMITVIAIITLQFNGYVLTRALDRSITR